MKLFEPITIKSMELKNRVVLPPMQLNLDFRNQNTRVLYAEWAKGGCGTIILPWTSVDMFLSDELWGHRGSVAEFVEGCRLLTDDVHTAGARVGIQLNHARYLPSGIGMNDTRGKPIAPSSVDDHHELTVEEVEVIIAKFAQAASECKRAGFDFVELHGAHSYLPCEFFSPLDNRRNDKYGGDLRRRMNFGLESTKAMRAAVGDNYPIFYRLGAWGARPGDTTLEDACEFAIELEKASVDCLDISVAKPGASPVPLPDQPMGTFVHLAEAVKRCVNVPIIAVGRINKLEIAESILEDGKADLIAIGRQLIADPYWPQKVATGRQDEVRPCLSCNVCLDSLWVGAGLQCSVNPFAGKETEYTLKPAKLRKKVLVVGGGPSGMEAAATLARRGHQVTLWEKERSLGGQLALASVAPHKGEVAELNKYLARQVEKSGVSISLRTEATVEQIENMKPDAVVLATGARPLLPQIPGIEGPKVVLSTDVLAGKAKVGQRAVIIGGELVGCETADYLADRCRQVTVMRRGKTFAANINPIARDDLLARLKRKGVALLPGVEYEKIIEEGVVIVREGKRQTIPADTVVVAAGAVPEASLVGALRARGLETYPIGDCASPGKIANALREAAWVGREI
jgi:2,4-dienoyl-CoA reductase-like NADH-dependent reductase (Old Yellow Enzyme family)/thioredoxin reductase